MEDGEGFDEGRAVGRKGCGSLARCPLLRKYLAFGSRAKRGRADPGKIGMATEHGGHRWTFGLWRTRFAVAGWGRQQSRPSGQLLDEAPVLRKNCRADLGATAARASG